MTIELSPKVASLLEQELSKGSYQGAVDLLERALTDYLEQLEVGRRQRDAIVRIGRAVDEAGLYDLVPDPPLRRHE